MIDQIPNLADLLRNLENLSILNTQAQVRENPFVLEQISNLRQSIVFGKDWEAIAEYQKQNFFSEKAIKDDMDEIMKLAESWSNQNVEALFDGFKCVTCHGEAVNRCKNCRTYWYCGKECQIKHWKNGHKNECKEISKTRDEQDALKK